PSVGGERPAAERLRDLLADAFGDAWSAGKQESLLAAAGFGGKTLAEWLRDGFFEQHCKLFHQRPFIWHIWDGRKDGFSALVNYHKLDYKLLERLTYTQLGEWIGQQERLNNAGEQGAEARLIAAQALQAKLKLILEGEAPYDIFVRWKAPHELPMGWHPDLNDGVRMNIRPLMMNEKGEVCAGVLRWKPNIKWGKDRGKNPPGTPYGEDRENDRHFTLDEKRKAREAAGEGK
ncbi:MAG: hypothetical protein QM473_17665, partial [Acidobacteriota bacterium]|nr:hypothetical protein [Acidobacteriota bacterium]